MSYGLVTADAAHLYVDEKKIDQEVREHLKNVRILPYDQIFQDLRAFDHDNKASFTSPQLG